MIPDRCTFCKGRLVLGMTEFIARAGGEVVVIRDVPAYVCEQCGEAYSTTATSRKIDGVMRDVHKKKLSCQPGSGRRSFIERVTGLSFYFLNCAYVRVFWCSLLFIRPEHCQITVRTLPSSGPLRGTAGRVRFYPP